MKLDVIIGFLLEGTFPFISSHLRFTRMMLIQILGHVEGINKKNGVYEILKKDNVLFYFGFGSMGNLGGIRIFDIQHLKIEYSFVLDLLQNNNINYEFDSDKMMCQIENGVKVYFDEEQKYILEILKAEDKTLEKRLTATNTAR